MQLTFSFHASFFKASTVDLFHDGSCYRLSSLTWFTSTDPFTLLSSETSRVILMQWWQQIIRMSQSLHEHYKHCGKNCFCIHLLCNMSSSFYSHSGHDSCTARLQMSIFMHFILLYIYNCCSVLFASTVEFIIFMTDHHSRYLTLSIQMDVLLLR